MKCRTVGGIIIGCGSDPCRCDEIDETLRRVFGRETDEEFESRLQREWEENKEIAEPPDDGMTPLERWLS